MNRAGPGGGSSFLLPSHAMPALKCLPWNSEWYIYCSYDVVSDKLWIFIITLWSGCECEYVEVKKFLCFHFVFEGLARGLLHANMLTIVKSFSPILSAICKWNCFAIYLSFNSGNKKKLLNKSTYRIYQSSSWDMLMCSCRCCDWGCCRPEVLKFFPSLYLFAVILPRSIEKFFLRSVLLSLISGCHCEDIIMSLQKKIVFPNPIYFYFF